MGDKGSCSSGMGSCSTDKKQPQQSGSCSTDKDQKSGGQKGGCA